MTGQQPPWHFKYTLDFSLYEVARLESINASRRNTPVAKLVLGAPIVTQ